MLPTIKDLSKSTLSLCYEEDKLKKLLSQAAAIGAVETLLSLPRTDARRVCAGMMARSQLVEWSAFAARRAKGYADAAANAAAYAADANAANAANAAATATANAAAYAADAAADAADADAADAYAAAAYRADHEIAIRDACRILGWE